MRGENELKAVLAELTLKNRVLTHAPAGGAGGKVCWAGNRLTERYSWANRIK